MDKKFDYLKAYFILCVIIILYLIRIFIPEVAPKLGWKSANGASIVFLFILNVVMNIFYFKGFKDMADIGFIQYILFIFTVSLGFGSTLLLLSLLFSSHWKLFYTIFCVLMLVKYGDLYKRSTPYISMFSNIIISLIINNLILLNTIIWDLISLNKFNDLLKDLEINLSGELIINLVLFPMLLMTSCGACINAKDEYYKNKGKDNVINKDKNTQPEENDQSKNNNSDGNKNK